MDSIIFGANILENITTGMYKDSKVSYREYIQNACDQIDKAVEIGLLSDRKDGEINIWLTPEDRTISIEDNATGIPQHLFEPTLANIADSDKKIGADKGFRGIGRLCGLAYCQELVFESTAVGEDTVSTMICNAKKMRELLNRNISGEKFTATEVLKEIFEFEYKKDSKVRDQHWFRVILKGVNDENRDLLDFAQVKNYLSFIAPVPFQNTFPYKKEIHDHAQEIGYTIDEYRIKMNGEQIFKKYSTHFKTSKGDDEVFGVEFKDFYDDNGNLVMWLWFGISKFKAIIAKECDMRGLRLRKENIQIGNDDALQGLFKEDRGQHYYIGEMYAVSKFLIPNSQRDYFNENATRAWFEQEVRKYFREVLTKIYYDASRINSSFSKIDSFDKKRQEHEEKIEKHDYVDAGHAQKATDDLTTARDAAEKAQGDLKRLEKSGGETEVSAVRQKVIQRIKKDRQQEEKTPVDADIPPIETPPPPTKQPRRTDRLSRCNKKERVLISKIFSIILSSTDDKTAEMIIQKIEEEFK